MNKIYVELIFTMLFLFVFYTGNAQFVIDEVVDASDEICNGQVTISTLPETATYTFLWNNGETTQNITNACPGENSVVITNELGCEVTLTAFVDGNGCIFNYGPIVPVIVKPCGNLPVGSISFDPSPMFAFIKGYSFTWSNGAIGSTIENLYPGTYSVVIDFPDGPNCSAVYEFILGCKKKENLDLLKGKLMVNEISNGSNDNDEYIELLVLGNDENCDPIDLRGFIIDDNNGDFSKQENRSSQTGISNGFLQLGQAKQWSSIPKGALILIYNSMNKNAAIELEDDPNDENGDGVYVLSANDPLIENHQFAPLNSEENYVRGNVANEQESLKASNHWNAIWMFNGADAIQVRYPNGMYCHGLSYGTTDLITGGPDNLLIHPFNGSNKVFFFNSGPIDDSNSYSFGHVLEGDETPGTANNLENAAFISAICDQEKTTEIKLTIPNTTAQTQVKTFPNPFTDIVQITLELEQNQDLQIELFDFLGRRMFHQFHQGQKGENRFELNFGKQLQHGTYKLLIQADQILLFEENIICAE